MADHWPHPESEHMKNVISKSESSKTPQVPVRRNTGLTLHQIKRYDAELPESAKRVYRQYSQLESFDVRRHTEAELKENESKRKELINHREWFESSFVRNVETDLARNMYNIDNMSTYQASARAVRDLITINWSNTQQQQALENGKRVYYFSLEFLMGRALDNALINTGIKKVVDESITELGFRLEDVLSQEDDAGLGNGGLGRLAACFVDSLSTRNYSGWGYGLNYQYGIFRQTIVDGYQVETPDNWLKYGSTWEVPRHEIQIPVSLYGHVVSKYDATTGREHRVWIGGDRVLAVPVDYAIPGYNTPNTNNLRLWSARPTHEFDFAKFNEGDYQSSVASLQRAEAITSVLYPNDNFESGKELRLKQQYFWVAASLHDVIRRFKKFSRPWAQFADYTAIQLNDTHPTLAVIELMRILLDIEKLGWDLAWSIVTRTFAYTNHTVMQEALEKWPLYLIERMLPRHMEIIYEINWHFLQYVESKFPGDGELRAQCSIIEEGPTKSVRMAYLAVIGSHKVNGVAELHSKLVKSELFPQFVKVFGEEKFTNVTNGVTPRRWLAAANPALTSLIAEALEDPGYEFLRHFDNLKKLEKFENDQEFLERWDVIKITNKKRVAKLVHETTGVRIDPHVMFDVQVKRIHEYKRQQLNIFAIIYRYLEIKKLLAAGLTPKEITEKHYIAKAYIIGGKAAPGYYMAKTIIHLVNAVAAVVNSDNEVGDLLKVVFVPDYNVSKAEILCAGTDLSNHISTAGTEGSGTSNMKFAINGGLIIGTVDGANVEITREIGEDNIFLFGVRAPEVPAALLANKNGVNLPLSLLEVFNVIDSGMFGNGDEFRPLLDSIRHHGDYYLVGTDFEMYLEAHRRVEKAYGIGHGDKDHLENWVKKCVHTVANMGFFSSDRAVDEYASRIWNIEQRQI